MKRASTFSGCHKTVIGGHVTIAWACRGCGKRACASCVHHYHASTRTAFKDAGPREFTCDDCLRKGRSLQRIEFNVGKLTPKRREDLLLLSPSELVSDAHHEGVQDGRSEERIEQANIEGLELT